MDSSNYILRATGWGRSCPKGLEINSKEECLSAAKTVMVDHGDISTAEQQHFQPQGQEEVEVFDNIWDYPPCGCFLWKNGHRVIFADPNDDKSIIKACTANQWAQLICKEGGEVEHAQFKEMDDPTLYDPRTYIDWIGFKPIRFWEDRRFCVGVNHENDSGTNKISIKLCNDIELKDDEHWFYGFYNELCTQDEICILEPQTTEGGADDDPSLILSTYGNQINKIERWSFNSDGRFQSVTKPDKYISVVGCKIKEGATLEITSLKDNCGQQFVQYTRYDVFNVTTKDICYVVIPFTVVFAFQLMFVILYIQHRKRIAGVGVAASSNNRNNNNNHNNARIENLLWRRRRRALESQAETIATNARAESSLQGNESVRARLSSE
mmetsp:Transcript_21961/g.32893  ORF Transcript_21961/g.32893 Transcript_21961/m.32893 type:complete len:381 (+) Transcript_21961:30-1172(+)